MGLICLASLTSHCAWGEVALLFVTGVWEELLLAMWYYTIRYDNYTSIQSVIFNMLDELSIYHQPDSLNIHILDSGHLHSRCFRYHAL